MAFLAKLRPMGPWRAGPETGERSVAGALLHSDALYSALTHAMAQLGRLEEWIAATAGNAQGSEVRFSSCFPFSGQLLFIAPPRSLWPLPPSLQVRWKSARLVPTTMVSLLVHNRKIREDDWVVDGSSECLLPVVRGQVVASPFRTSIRSAAAVDRLGDGVAPHRTACVEFQKDAGIWVAFDFTSDGARQRWTKPLQGALRLLADTGLGGGRSRGWGRFEQPTFSEGPLHHLILGRHTQAIPADSGAYWLLSLFTPSETNDQVDWKQGNYEIALRNGRIEAQTAWGAAKKSSKMVSEGSVLAAAKPLQGAAYDVAPEGFAHPVYRAGFALALPLAGSRKVEAQIEESTQAEPETAEPVMQDSEPGVEALPDVVTEPKPEIEGVVTPTTDALVRLGDEAPLSEPEVPVTQESELDSDTTVGPAPITGDTESEKALVQLGDEAPLTEPEDMPVPAEPEVVEAEPEVAPVPEPELEGVVTPTTDALMRLGDEAPLNEPEVPVTQVTEPDKDKTVGPAPIPEPVDEEPHGVVRQRDEGPVQEPNKEESRGDGDV